MKVEFELNTFDYSEWWFDLGVSISKTAYHPGYTHCFSLALAFCTLYVRWGSWKTKNKIK